MFYRYQPLEAELISYESEKYRNIWRDDVQTRISFKDSHKHKHHRSFVISLKIARTIVNWKEATSMKPPRGDEGTKKREESIQQGGEVFSLSEAIHSSETDKC